MENNSSSRPIKSLHLFSQLYGIDDFLFQEPFANGNPHIGNGGRIQPYDTFVDGWIILKEYSGGSLLKAHIKVDKPHTFALVEKTNAIPEAPKVCFRGLSTCLLGVTSNLRRTKFHWDRSGLCPLLWNSCFRNKGTRHPTKSLACDVQISLTKIWHPVKILPYDTAPEMLGLCK